MKTQQMIKSYYNNTDETNTAIDSEGWFHTGDVVELIGKSKIRIIDRVKNFFKLSQVRNMMIIKPAIASFSISEIACLG